MKGIITLALALCGAATITGAGNVCTPAAVRHNAHNVQKQVQVIETVEQPDNYNHSYCDIEGCTIKEEHKHGECGVENCRQAGQHNHAERRKHTENTNRSAWNGRHHSENRNYRSQGNGHHSSGRGHHQ